MGAVIVKNQMQLRSDRHCRINGFQEAAKLNCTMAPMKLANHTPGLDVQRGEQIDGAVALVIRGAAFGLAGAHRQQRLAAIERLLGRRYGVLGALTGIAGTVGATAGPVVAGRIFDMTNSYVGAFELFILLDIIGAVAAFACKPYSSQKGQALRSLQYRPPRSSELR